MILVTGATGHFGKAAIDYLLEKRAAGSIAGLVRDESKAAELISKGVTVKTGSYDDYSSLVNAFGDVDKLLFVSGSEVSKRSMQHQNVVKAAKEAGVKHILYTSFERKNETETSPVAFIGKSHLETERNIMASGISYTIFRNNLYMDYIPVFTGDKVLENGIFLPAGKTKAAFALRDEMAEAAACVLTGEGHEGKEYHISNTENYSFQDVADVLSKISGKAISYVSPDVNVYKDVLSKAGVPEEAIEAAFSFAEAIKQGEFEMDTADLMKLLGRKPMALSDYLINAYPMH